ncbi:uncharacterized protein LOC122931329 [Bufo gargarizans]|uniref:uncharacterized protein LOC122925850 n=1 Tax=Bufo gargarizans TaxID=30331 RepID=UPI001CF15FE1|nr:uncharacterized protein LOC122925850 [Bufo gargarizans]XP_044141329.1 uncharacterized protein LOC122931329 [Bufo gargarizans]
MVKRFFKEDEEGFLLTHMLEKGYHRTRKHATKDAIITELIEEMEEKFHRRPTKASIQKKWCDLKRHHMDRINKESAEICPGDPVPTVKKRKSQEMVVTSDEEEELENQAEEEQPGPSQISLESEEPPQPGESSPPPPAEEEAEPVYTPHQEVICKLKRRLQEHQKAEANELLAIKETNTKICKLQARLKKHQRQMNIQLRKLEEHRKLRNKELQDIQKELRNFP